MKIPPLIFHIDVSGQPTEEIHVGMTSIMVNELSDFVNNLKKNRPQFLRHNFKGSKLPFNDIKSYIHYFNGQRIRMRNIRFKSPYWTDLKKYLENKKYWKEIIYATLYFIALKEYSKENCSYPVVVCHETYLNIESVKNYLKKLGKAHKVEYQISHSYAIQNIMIKVSDIVAIAGKKRGNFKFDLDFYKEECPDLKLLKFYIKKLKE